MIDPVASLAELYDTLHKAAPSLTPQPIPRQFAYGEAGLIDLCITEQQKAQVRQLIAKYQTLEDKSRFQIIGSFDSQTRQYHLQKAVWMNEHESMIHNVGESMQAVMECRMLQSTGHAEEREKKLHQAINCFLKQNDLQREDFPFLHCLNIAYRIHIILRAFPKLPLCIANCPIDIQPDTDVEALFLPLFQVHTSVKASTKKSKKRKKL